ncbi:hypothetical protein [Thalassovita aquimarina]|nr:hypothetical protein [Thalassovita aquimarina]
MAAASGMIVLNGFSSNTGGQIDLAAGHGRERIAYSIQPCSL